MGLRGPAPKLEEHRLRQNTDYRPITKVEPGQETPAPMLPDENWHPIAIEFFLSYEQSAQAHLFEPSDWAKVYFMCEALSRELKPQFIGWAEGVQVVEVNGKEQVHPVKKPMQGKVPIKGSTLSALNAMMTTLLTTEADRRRLSIEIKRGSGGEEEQSAGDKVAATVVDMFTKKPPKQA